MQRSSRFREEWLPLKHDARLKPSLSTTRGPVGFLNPTLIHFSPRRNSTTTQESKLTAKLNGDDASTKSNDPADAVSYRWTARNNRKGRHQLEVIPAKDPKTARFMVPASSSAPREVMRIIFHMITKYPLWDVSWLVAYIFWWGSLVWIINAFFVWLPLVRPKTEFSTEIYLGGGITAFIGATIFEIGSILLLAEAINENREGCFGWAVQELLEGAHDRWRLMPSAQHCQHHHANRRNLVGKGALPSAQAGPPDPEKSLSERAPNSGSGGQSWVWFPSLREIRNHYIHELGFLACSWQLFGASIFWISGFTALPGIFNHLHGSSLIGVYWTPQVIGGSGFIISGILFMLETQDKWYKPALGILGWHIGFWNAIGGLGFTLCPAFGYDTSSWAVFESSLATFWGSWAFMIASTLQLFESLQKSPVDIKAEPKTTPDIKQRP